MASVKSAIATTSRSDGGAVVEDNRATHAGHTNLCPVAGGGCRAHRAAGHTRFLPLLAENSRRPSGTDCRPIFHRATTEPNTSASVCSFAAAVCGSNNLHAALVNDLPSPCRLGMLSGFFMTPDHGRQARRVGGSHNAECPRHHVGNQVIAARIDGSGRRAGLVPPGKSAALSRRTWGSVSRFGIKSPPRWCSRQAEFHHILSRRAPVGLALRHERRAGRATVSGNGRRWR
jgi:hypothetical protein